MIDDIPLTESLNNYEQKCTQVLEGIASTKDQLSRARSHAASTGDYSDHKWFQAANSALRKKQILHQTLLRDAAKLRRELSAARSVADEAGRSFERQLMVEAKAILPGATYAEIIRRTQQASKGVS